MGVLSVLFQKLNGASASSKHVGRQRNFRKNFWIIPNPRAIRSCASRKEKEKKKKVYQTTRKKVTSCRCARSGASPISDHPTRKMAEERKQKVSGFFQTSGEQSNSRDREIQNDFKRKSYRVVCLSRGRKNRDRGLRRSGEISYDFRGWKFWKREEKS